MSKHIFIVTSNLTLGGIQKKIQDIAWNADASRLPVREKYIFHLIFRSSDSFISLPQHSSRFLLHQEKNWPILRRYNDYYFKIYIGLLYLRYRPQAIMVFLHHLLSYILPLKQLPFFSSLTKLIVVQETTLSYYNQPAHSQPVYTKKQIQHLYRQVNQVFVQTLAAKQDLITNFRCPSQKIVVLPCWLPTSFSRRGKIWPKKDIDVIFAGRFAPQKRLELFLQVIQKVIVNYPRLRVVLIGDGEEKLRLKELAKKMNLLSQVTFLPRTKQIRSYLTRSKILLLTSEFEGQPVVLLEAMKCRAVPVILRYPGVEEYVDDQKVGYIETSVNRAAIRMRQLLTDAQLLKTVARSAEQYVDQHFNTQQLKDFLEATTSK